MQTLDMIGAVTYGKGEDFKLTPLKIRKPRHEEVLVKIIATGMCHTDLIVRDQFYPVALPAVLGHEGSGIIEEIGPDVKDLKVGDHVVLSFGYCGKCTKCHTGNPAFCIDNYSCNFPGSEVNDNETIFSRDNKNINDHFFDQSSFATYAISQEKNTIKVRKDVPLEILGPLGCGIQTGAASTIKCLQVTPASSFITWGAGAVGLSALLAAIVCGASTIIAIDIVDSRLELAKELGATHVINSKTQDPVESIKEITQKAGVDFAIETTGRPAILKQAIDSLASLGKLGIVGAPPLGTNAEFDVNDMLLNGKTIMGIVQGNSVPKKFIPELIELFRLGKFPFDKLLKFYNYEDINQAAIDSEKGITLKPIIKIS